MKTCATCLIEKPFTEFYKGTGRSKFTSYCKPCYILRVKKNYRSEKGQEAYHRNRLKRDFGLSLEKFKEMRSEQNNCCAICGIHESLTRKKILCVDHCHKTGKVRGLLCDTCNRAIGLLKDSPESLYSAYNYVSGFWE